MLGRCAGGFGAVALAGLMANDSEADENVASDSAGPFAPKPPHFEPQVDRVIFLYMDGGPSQVDTFDPKPRLDQENGKPFAMKIEPTQFNNIGKVFISLGG